MEKSLPEIIEKLKDAPDSVLYHIISLEADHILPDMQAMSDSAGDIERKVRPTKSVDEKNIDRIIKKEQANREKEIPFSLETLLGEDLLEDKKIEIQSRICKSDVIQKYVLSKEIQDKTELVLQIVTLITGIFQSPYVLVSTALMICRYGIKVYCKNFLPE